MTGPLTAGEPLAPRMRANRQPPEPQQGAEPPRQPPRRRGLLICIMRGLAGAILGILLLVGLAGAGGGYLAYQHFSAGLPDVDGLSRGQIARALGRTLHRRAAGFDDHARSFRSGRREENAALTGTICDALMARMPGKMTFAINQSLVGAGLVVSDEEVAAAVAFAFAELKLVVEPGGAVALAALMHRKVDVKDKIGVAVLSGGNVDPELFSRLVA